MSADGRSWRSGAIVEKRLLKQWFLGITQYADRLHAGLDTLQWPQHVLDMQRQWIGRSEGFEFRLGLAGQPSGERSSTATIAAFTTRPDTVYGASFVAVSPSHAVLAAAAPEYTAGIERLREVVNARGKAGGAGGSGGSSDEGDGADAVPTGLSVMHPMTGVLLPVFSASYVLDGYGTGAVVGVPAHDARDLALARRFGLPVTRVRQIAPFATLALPSRSSCACAV